MLRRWHALKEVAEATITACLVCCTHGPLMTPTFDDDNHSNVNHSNDHG